MSFAAWCVVSGLVLVLMALSATVLKRLPLSSAMLYLALGYALGPGGLGVLDLDALRDAPALERITEVAVLVSLFVAGLKLRVPLRDVRWRVPLRLATLSMVLTVAAIALAGVLILGLSPGAAILLGAVLAPTDPVLASDVQVADPYDRDHLRFGLTGEAGMNDGTAFPFVMLGLALLGLHDTGPFGWRWWVVDLAWAVVAGLGTGAVLGWAVARGVLLLRRRYREAVGMEDFLALGLIALAYGTALLVHAYGFLAVFAAGVALRRVERLEAREVREAGGGREIHGDGPAAPLLAPDMATHPDRAPAYMAQAVLAYNEQLERIVEVVVVVAIGALLGGIAPGLASVAMTALLLAVIRPLAVVAGLAGTAVSGQRLGLMGWFGIRGVGSLYYLSYALTHGLAGEEARVLVEVTLLGVAASIVLHGVSVTPLMQWYGRRRRPPAGE